MSIEPIRRLPFNDADRAAVQDAAIKAVETDPEAFIAAYIADPKSHGGRYIAADLFKEHFPAFNDSKDSRNRYNTPVHNSAAVLSAELFRRRLAADEPDRDTVIFLTGIPGAGKTSSVLAGGQLPDDCRLVFEGQLSKPGPTLEKIQQALDAGLRPVIIAVHTRPENALDNTLIRFDEYGRGASINVMADIQGNLPDSLKAVHEQFGDQVQLIVRDYRDRRDHHPLKGWTHLDVLRSEGAHHEIRDRLNAALEQRKDSITEAAWRQAAGHPPAPLVRAMGSRHDGQPQQDEQRSGISEASNPPPVLNDLATFAQVFGEAFNQAGTLDQVAADALATEAEQQERDQSAEVDRDAGHPPATYENELQTHIEAKQQQVERIESRLEALIEQQEARLLQTQQSKPGMLAMPSTRNAWRERQEEQRARLQGLHARLERVQSLREGMSTHGPKLEELATRKLRTQNPELAAEWDESQAQARREQLEQRQAKKKGQQQAQGRSQTLGLAKPE